MSLTSKDVLGFALALGLAGLAAVFGASGLLGVILLSGAVIALLLVVLHMLWTRLPKVYLGAHQAKEAARRVYEEAARKGGELAATHIFPRDTEPGNDLALEILSRAAPKSPLIYERIIIVDNPDLESTWVNGMFEEVRRSVNLSLYVLTRYPLLFPRLVKAVIPRVNLLLYRKNGRHFSLVGLDQLELLGGSPQGSFAISFRGKSVFDMLHRYFDSITSYGGISQVRDAQEYEAERDPRLYRRGTLPAIATLVNVAEAEPRILHMGLFGSVAKQESGLFPEVFGREHESDIDIILVCSRDNQVTLQQVKDLITTVLPADQYEIVWGDDEDYFYEWRTPGKLTVDVELHYYGSSFYRDHRLLGSSVFWYYWPIYSVRGRSVSSCLGIDRALLPEKVRWELVLRDRKGLEAFVSRLSAAVERVDPRRVASLTVRNVAWAASGHHPGTTDLGIRYLAHDWSTIFPDADASEIRSLLALEYDEARRTQDDGISLARSLVAGAVEFARQRLDD